LLPSLPPAGTLPPAFLETGTLFLQVGKMPPAFVGVDPSLTVPRKSCPPFNRAGTLLPSLPPARTSPPAFVGAGTLFLQVGKMPPAFVGVDPSLTVTRKSFPPFNRTGALLPSLPPAGTWLTASV